ncbi:MAG TPA: monovalent cation/H(+) antiporter subunit G [Beutenbergiaceae bacterium]|nr:monovalent cation/H(+) antiporter subunit G [Beutenbergiaceae bacterium]
MTVWDVVGQVFILAGVVLFAVAGAGLFRFPDVYTRVSAVGTAAGLGIGLIVVGALALQPGLASGIKVLGIVIFQLSTSAVATSAIGRAAYLARSPINRVTFNELTATEPPDEGQDPEMRPGDGTGPAGRPNEG